MLGFVGQVRAAILHLRDACFRVVRIHPLLVGQRLLALAIESLALGRRRLFHPFGLHQAGDMVVVAVAVVPSHDGLQRRIGLQRGGVDT